MLGPFLPAISSVRTLSGPIWWILDISLLQKSITDPWFTCRRQFHDANCYKYIVRYSICHLGNRHTVHMCDTPRLGCLISGSILIGYENCLQNSSGWSEWQCFRKRHNHSINGDEVSRIVLVLFFIYYFSSCYSETFLCVFPFSSRYYFYFSSC